MNNNNDRFNHLLHRYALGLISPEEREELFEMLTSNEYDATLSEAIIRDLSHNDPQGKTDLPPHISEEIVRNIFHAERNVSALLPKKRSSSRFRWYIAAAACLAGLIFFARYFNSSPGKFSSASFNALIPDNAVSQFNSTSKVKVVGLPDGSTVSLQPQSSVYYRGDFTTNEREVYLKGEAFFKIAKNARRPFLVYYQNIVTKVLGTSFNINTNPATGRIEVVVKTGKVQVYENERLLGGKRENNAVIVTPNQKAIYKEDNRMFQTTLVELPEPIADSQYADARSVSSHRISFVYDQQKLKNVFEQLEKIYGIEIAVENEGINDCVFTGDISDNNLYNKLKIICLTTNSSFEINGTTILIKGNGCN